MKALIIASALAFSSVPAYAMLAFFTGQSHVTTSVTGQLMVQCEYQIGSNRFWVNEAGGVCQMSIDVN